MSSHSSVIAAFDFDHTLINRDSLIPFLISLQGFWKTFFALSCLLPSFLRYLVGNLSRQEIKERILMSSLAGRAYADLEIVGRRYADQQIDDFLKPEAFDRLKWHQSQGHRCLLISASLELYLSPWAKRHGFEAVLASRLELTPEGNVTGNLKGLNCWGAEKVLRLNLYATPNSYDQLYMYGDSRGDAELLSLADHPFYRTFS